MISTYKCRYGFGCIEDWNFMDPSVRYLAVSESQTAQANPDGSALATLDMPLYKNIVKNPKAVNSILNKCCLIGACVVFGNFCANVQKALHATHH